MEEIINKLIDIDNMSKGIINKVEEKNLKIDELVENEIDKQKSAIDSPFLISNSLTINSTISCGVKTIPTSGSST